MEDKSNEESGFKVVDRRRFTGEGDPKEPSTEEFDSPSSQQSASKPNATESPKNTASAEPRSSGPNSSSAHAAGQEPLSVDFPSFVVSLATQAMMMMGAMPNPETNQIAENLEGARQTIDILAMLEEKTKGNLSSEESQLMTEVLSSLRLGYVRMRSGM